jgi:uncharacterized protein
MNVEKSSGRRFISSQWQLRAAKTYRAISFLFSRNRLNVAISLAQCLAFLVCSPRLLEARCNSIEEMELVNALCRLAEYAEQERA